MVMVFSSVKFLLYFLPIFLILYGLVPERIKNLVLLAGSLIFYALGDVKSLPLLMMSVLVNYFLGLRLDKRVATTKESCKGKGRKMPQQGRDKRAEKEKRRIIENMGKAVTKESAGRYLSLLSCSMWGFWQCTNM